MAFSFAGDPMREVAGPDLKLLIDNFCSDDGLGAKIKAENNLQ